MKVRLRELELKSKVELELLSKKLETLQYLKSKIKTNIKINKLKNNAKNSYS